MCKDAISVLGHTSMTIHCSSIHIHTQQCALGGILTATPYPAGTMNCDDTLHLVTLTTHTYVGEQWLTSSLYHSPPSTANDGESLVDFMLCD